MRALLIFLLAAGASLGQAPYRSMLGESGKYGTASLPSNATWNARTTFRVEFRLHDWTSTGGAMSIGDIYCARNANNIACTNFYEPGSPTINAAIPAGATDVIVRVQRSTVMYSIELWRSDGSEYVPGGFEPTSAPSVNLSGAVLAVLHYGGGSNQLAARMAWLRVYSTAVTRNSAMPTNIVGGDLIDWELEGNGTDTSGNGINLTLTGSPTFPSTPVVPLLGEEFTIRSGASFTPSCAGTNADSYRWWQQGGPTLSVAFSDTTAATPTVTGLTGFGQYNLVCEATINGVTGRTIVPVGAVATNDAGVVIVADSTIRQLLGPMLRSGVSEWGWYDQQRKIMGKYWADNRSGYTIDFTNVESENYYDACLVQYQNYYRTGLTRFQTYARACSDKWYSQFWSARATAGTCGENFIAPRQSSMVSLAIRGHELGESSGGTRWTCLTAYAGFSLNLWVELRTFPGEVNLYFGAREVGYALINAAAIAVANPDSAVRSSYSSRLAAGLTNPIRALQCQPGMTIAPCREVYTSGAGTITATNGSTAVTGSGSNFASLFAPSGDGLIFNGGSATQRVTVASRASDTALTLSANLAGATATNTMYAKNTITPDAYLGTWRWDENSNGYIGYGEFLWHTGLLLEAVDRIYQGGIETTITAQIGAEYGQYLLDKQAIYYNTAQVCTGAFGNVPVRSVRYASYYGAYDGMFPADCNDNNQLRDARQANTLVTESAGFGFLLTGNTALRALGDDMWAATFGQWVGPGADGGFGLASSQGNTGKFLGQSFRNGSYLVHRLGAAANVLTAQPTNLSASVRIADIPTATKVRLTLTKPDSTTSTATCTTMPCVVVGDRRQGDRVTLRVEYLSAGDQVLSSGLAVAATLP